MHGETFKFINARMCFVSHHESVPEGYATVSHDDGDGAGDVGTTAGNTRFGGDHAQGS